MSTTDATPRPKPKKKMSKPRMDSRPGKWEGRIRERRPPRRVTRLQGEITPEPLLPLYYNPKLSLSSDGKI